jgi:hypothetical protein
MIDWQHRVGRNWLVWLASRGLFDRPARGGFERVRSPVGCEPLSQTCRNATLTSRGGFR